MNIQDFPQIAEKNETVLLRGHKRHNTRRVASTRSAVLSGEKGVPQFWLGGTHPDLAGVVPIPDLAGGVPRPDLAWGEGVTLYWGTPQDWVSPWLGLGSSPERTLGQ